MNVQERRRRIAYGLLLFGALCLLVSVTTVMKSRAERERLEVRPVSAAAPTTQLYEIRPLLARYWLATAGALVAVFLIASLAMTRFRRRLIAMITAKPAPPSASEDVWQMHKLPEDQPDQDDEPLVDLPPEERP